MNAPIILTTLWTVTWQSTLLIGIILLLRAALRNHLSARWRYSLWGILGLRLALPVLPSNPLGLLPASGPTESAAVALPEAVNGAMALEPVAVIGAAGLEPATAAVPWPSLLVGIWLLGVLLFFGRFVLRTRRLHQWLNEASTENSAWGGEVATACSDLGLKSVPAIFQVPGSTSPVVFGCVRPVLVLPEDTMNALDADERLAVLRHEASHLKAKDTWTEMLRALLLCVHWFNPLLWWANRFFVADREEACDERVLAATGSQPENYGEALLAVLRVRSGAAAPAGALGVLDHSLKQRIIGIRRFRPSGPVRRGIAVLLAASVAFFGLTWAQGPDLKRGGNPEQETVAALKKVQIDILNFQQAQLPDVVAFLNAKLKASGVTVNVKPMKDMPRVSINLRRVSAHDALLFIADVTETKMTFPANKSVLLGPAQGAAKAAAQPKVEAIEAGTIAALKKAQIDVLHFQGAQLSDVIAFLNHKLEGTDLAVNLKPMKNMPRVSIRLRGISAYDALTTLEKLTETKMTFPTRSSVLIGPADAKAVAKADAPAGGRVVRLRQQLDALTNQQQKLLQQGLGARHPEVLAKRNQIQAVIRQIRQAEFVPVTLNLRQVPLSQALTATCAQAGMSFRVEENGFVLVRPGGKNSMADTPEAKATFENLQAIRIPELRFKNADLADVLDFFRAVAKERAPNEVVNIIQTTK